jgi:hypothetical protein
MLVLVVAGKNLPPRLVHLAHSNLGIASAVTKSQRSPMLVWNVSVLLIAAANLPHSHSRQRLSRSEVPQLFRHVGASNLSSQGMY